MDMKERQILQYREAITINMHTKEQHSARSSRLLLGSVLGMLILLLAACGTTSSSDTMAAATPRVVRVNGFGTAANHPHAFLVFPNNVLVLATHYGTFWS